MRFQSIATLLLGLALSACHPNQTTHTLQPVEKPPLNAPEKMSAQEKIEATASEHPEEKHMQRRKISAAGYDITPLSKAEIERLAKDLTADQRHVLLKAGTEAPFCGGVLNNKKTGIYVSALGGLPLFKAKAKFDSGTGWPSFYEPFDPAHIIERSDDSLGRERIEILDARSGGHLGHVFDDGPPPTGRRYCLNSAALIFIAEGDLIPKESQPIKMQKAYFAGGCFWGVEDVLQFTPGVIEATSGYMGGQVKEPDYHAVCSGETGHAETVEVTYDADIVSYRALLERFFAKIDPTTLNRQGPDQGTQYRSAIFAVNAEQKQIAEAYLKELGASSRFAGRKIVTTVEMGGQFWPAEEYHQNYHEKHGGSCGI